MKKFRIETDSLGEVKVPDDKLWGAQTQRSLECFCVGDDHIPSEMVIAYAILKKAAAIANNLCGVLPEHKSKLIIQVCDEILAGKHDDMFPLHVWMTGSGTQFNMNVNEVISNRCCQLAGQPLGSKNPIHPNDDANMSQSSNDTFPTAMNMSAASITTQKLLPALQKLRDSIHSKSEQWREIIKIGRTHLQDATPLTLGQEFSGYVAMLDSNIKRITDSLSDVYQLALGGTAVGTGLNAPRNFDKLAIAQIAELTELPFVPAVNKFAALASHDALVQLSATLKTIATAIYKIVNDIRILSCGPRAGIYELLIPANEPGSSIMPGKINPTQCESLSMIAIQVMANDTAVTFGGANGHLELNVYKPLIIHNILKSVRLLTDGANNFRKFLVEGMEPNKKQIATYVERSLMLVTALSPVIGYDNASKIANYAYEHDLSLKEAALRLGFVTSEEFNRIVNPANMLGPT